MKLGFELRVKFPDGETVGADKLTKQQKNQWEDNMVGRLKVAMDAYYSNHPDEYKKLCGA